MVFDVEPQDARQSIGSREKETVQALVKLKNTPGKFDEKTVRLENALAQQGESVAALENELKLQRSANRHMKRNLHKHRDEVEFLRRAMRSQLSKIVAMRNRLIEKDESENEKLTNLENKETVPLIPHLDSKDQTSFSSEDENNTQHPPIVFVLPEFLEQSLQRLTEAERSTVWNEDRQAEEYFEPDNAQEVEYLEEDASALNELGISNEKDGLSEETTITRCLTQRRENKMPLKRTTKLFICKVCKMGFSSFVFLKQHAKDVHRQVQQIVCTICGKSFYQLHYFKKHLRLHRDSDDSECRVCGQTFTYSTLESHMLQHGPFLCDLSVRSTLFPLNCKHCNKQNFKNEENLQTHVMNYHTDDGGTFTCEQCDRILISKEAYENHLKFHRGVLRYKCKSCDMLFTTRKCLDHHTCYCVM